MSPEARALLDAPLPPDPTPRQAAAALAVLAEARHDIRSTLADARDAVRSAQSDAAKHARLVSHLAPFLTLPDDELLPTL